MGEIHRKRDRKARGPRAKTVTARRSRRLPILPTSYPEDEERPRTRSECPERSRPCPWVACKYHLYLDVTAAGSLKINFPTMEPWEIPETCSLDAAEKPRTLDEVGDMMNLTRERVRQVQVHGLGMLRTLLQDLE